jgi:hypothetical protein
VTLLTVGAPYSPGVTRYPEVAQYNYRQGQHELVLFLERPSNPEQEAVRKGEAEFALYVDGPAIVLAYRFGSAVPWSDATYSWHLVPAEQRDLPSADIEASVRATIQVVLVDARTGIVRGLRLLSLSPEVTRALHQAIRDQSLRPWDQAEYDLELARLFGRYTSEQLVERALARCRGGS